MPAGVRTFRPPGLEYLRIIETAASVRLVLLAAADDVSRLVSESFNVIADDLGDTMRTILQTNKA